MIYTVQELKSVLEKRGSHFFSASAMRGFDSYVSGRLYPTCLGAYFVTSERDRGVWISSGWIGPAWNGERRYTVRFCNYNGTLSHPDNWEDYHGNYRSRTNAHLWAKTYQIRAYEDVAGHYSEVFGGW
jgi:hypothetical protein